MQVFRYLLETSKRHAAGECVEHNGCYCLLSPISLFPGSRLARVQTGDSHLNTAVSNIEEKRGMLFVRGANISERRSYSFFAPIMFMAEARLESLYLHGSG